MRLLRKDDRTQKMTPHGFFPVDVTEEAILKEYGGGHYRVQLLIPDAGGREQIKRSRDIHLPGPYRPPTGDLPGIGTRDPKITHPNAPPAPSPNGGSPQPQVNDILSAGVLQLFQASATQQQMMMQMFSAAQQSQAALLQAILGNKGPDFTAILTAVTPLVTEFMRRPKEERDPLEMLRAVGEIVKQNTGKTSDAAETIGMLRDLMDLKNEIAPESRGTGDPLLDSLPKLAEVMYEGWQQQKAGRIAVAGTVPRAALPNPQPAAVPTETTETIPADMPLYKIVLKREGARLVQQAAAGRDPALVAGMAIEFAPPNVKGALEEFFRKDAEAVAAELVQEIPALQQFPTWTAEFIGAVQDILFPEDDIDDEEKETE